MLKIQKPNWYINNVFSNFSIPDSYQFRRKQTDTGDEMGQPDPSPGKDWRGVGAGKLTVTPVQVLG